MLTSKPHGHVASWGFIFRASEVSFVFARLALTQEAFIDRDKARHIEPQCGKGQCSNLLQ